MKEMAGNKNYSAAKNTNTQFKVKYVKKHKSEFGKNMATFLVGWHLLHNVTKNTIQVLANILLTQKNLATMGIFLVSWHKTLIATKNTIQIMSINTKIFGYNEIILCFLPTCPKTCLCHIWSLLLAILGIMLLVIFWNVFPAKIKSCC